MADRVDRLQEPPPSSPEPERIPLRQAAIQADMSMKTARRYLKRGLLQFDRGPKGVYLIDPEELRQVGEEVRSRMHANDGAGPRLKKRQGKQKKPADPIESVAADGGQPDDQEPDNVSSEPVRGDCPGPDAKAEIVSEPIPGSSHVHAPAAADSLLVSAMPAEDRLPPLNARVRLVSILSRTASLCVRRVPVDKGDAGLWALARVPIFESFTRAELLKAAAQGGLDVLLSTKLGTGRYEVRWVSPYGTILHSEKRIVPDMTLEAGRFQAQAAAQERAQRKTRESAKRRRLERRREQQLMAQFAAFDRQRDDWVRAVMPIVFAEFQRRQRWLTSLRMILLAEGERRLERWSSDCALLAARIRREGPGPFDDLNRGLYPPRPPVITPEEAPILAALERVAGVDPEVVLTRAQEIVSRFFEVRGPAHPLHPGLLAAVEAVMPFVPATGLEAVTFVPWSLPELWPALGAA